MPTIKLSITMEKEVLDALDEFVSQFERLERSETIETMVFYCLAHDKALEEISAVLEGEEEEEEEEEESEAEAEE